MKQISKTSILLTCIILVGSFLRLHQHSQWSLTNDELSAIFGLSFGSLYNNINSYVLTDFHPAGVQVILWFWTQLFGTSVAAVRLPFVLMGILSLWFNFQIAKKWFNQNVALLATAALAVSQYAVLYSQLARPYSSGLFFTLLMVYGWTGIIQDTTSNKNIKSYVLFTVGMILCMYNHYFSFLFAGIVGITGLLLVQKQQLKYYLLSGLVAIICFIPHLQITISQFSAGGLGWLGPPNRSYFADYTKYIFNGSKLYLLVIVVFVVVAAIKLPLKLYWSKYHTISILWFLVPLFTAYFYSVYVSPVLQHSILLFSFPFLLIFLFSFTPINQKLTPYLVLLILLCGTLQIKVVNRFNGSNEFARFKEIAQHIKDADTKYGANNISHAINIVSPFYINYYLKDLNHQTSFLFTQNIGRDSIFKVTEIVKQCHTKYFMYCWTNADSPAEINEIIKTKYPYLIEKKLYYNSEFYFYSSDKKDSLLNLDIVNQRYCLNQQSSVFESCLNNQNWLNADTSFIQMNKSNEYSSALKLELKQMIKNTADVINISVMVKTKNDTDDAQIICALDNENKNYFWASNNLKYFVMEPNKWTTCYFSVRLPQLKTAEDILAIYLYNPNKCEFQFKNFCITSQAGNPIFYGLRKDAWINENLNK
jgi:hypothetical protein